MLIPVASPAEAEAKALAAPTAPAASSTSSAVAQPLVGAATPRRPTQTELPAVAPRKVTLPELAADGFGPTRRPSTAERPALGQTGDAFAPVRRPSLTEIPIVAVPVTPRTQTLSGIPAVQLAGHLGSGRADRGHGSHGHSRSRR